jgi:soluble lytic murein transglycosylase
MTRKSLIAVAIALLGATGSPAAAQSASQARADIAAPRVLSSEDARLYREIFADERAGHFPAARQLAGELADRSLMGYVEAEHFLSPKGKRTPLAQLKEWLASNAELPIAERVRELAEKRNRRHKVAIAALPPIHKRGGGYEDLDLPDPPMASEAGRTAQIQIEADIHSSQPAAAEAVLQPLSSDDSVPASDIARLSHRVAASYLAEGQDDAALRVASALSESDRAAAPLLSWDAGLASYRLGKFDNAAQQFETLAQVGSVPGYTRSAAAFWAAKAHMQAGDPLRVVTLLTAAAREQPTFYGLVAERLLGQHSQPEFSEPVLSASDFETLMQIAPAHRAVALWQVGQTEDLAGEMDRALSAIDLHLGPAYAALAQRLDLPNQELRACETAASRGVMLTGLFPIPRYAPPGGYNVDPALVLAFVRTESRFQANAVSGAGARGLMQIMPGTAAHMDGGADSEKLLDDPSYNLGLGQRYLARLLDQLNGNIIELAAAYDAGPGSVTRWKGTRSAMLDDPLLFIESIPTAETRNYVKRVLTYYWLYSRRSGEEAPSLDETASGKWPQYHASAARLPSPVEPSAPLVVSDAVTSH